jgi:hypothetical protein
MKIHTRDWKSKSLIKTYSGGVELVPSPPEGVNGGGAEMTA